MSATNTFPHFVRDANLGPQLLAMYQVNRPGVPAVPTVVDLNAGADPVTGYIPALTDMAIGPLALQVDDLIHVHLRMVVSNPNQDMNGPFPAPADENLGLPVELSVQVRRHIAQAIDGGAFILRPISENVEYWSRNHYVSDHAQWWRVDVNGNYVIFNQYQFASSPSYRQAGDVIHVESGNYGLLEVAHYRQPPDPT